MATQLPRTSERLVPCDFTSQDHYINYLRHRFAYEYAAQRLPAGAGVLDLGSGEGWGTSLLAEHVHAVVGVDVDAAVVTHANFQYGRANCRFVQYGGGRLPFDDSAFDAVVSFQVLEHIKDDHWALAEMVRVLRPNGTLILTTPNRVNRVAPGRKPWNRYHVREYSAGELHTLLSTAMAEVKVRGITARPAVHAVEMARVRQSRRIVAMDPLGLRRLLPGWVELMVVRALRILVPRPGAATSFRDWQRRFSLADFLVTDENVDDCLDLLAECRL